MLFPRLLALLLALALGASAPQALRAQASDAAPPPSAPPRPMLTRDAPGAAKDLGPAPGPAQLPSNVIQAAVARGDTLWFGPLLYAAPGLGDVPPFLAAGLDDLVDGRPEVFSFAADAAPGGGNYTLWAGLARAIGNGQGAAGFVFSTDGGQTFAALPPPLDAPDDTEVTYGTQTIEAVPVTQEQGSEPGGVALDPVSGAVWSANTNAGLRRSTDQGQTWDRIVLPPDSLGRIVPDPATPYDFVLRPRTNPVQGAPGFYNHVALSVLVAENGTVWAGTLDGLNRSTPMDVDPSTGDRAWTHVTAAPEADGSSALTGNAVVRLAEQRLTAPGTENPIWIAAWAFNQRPDDRQRFGVVVTRDNGATYAPVLLDAQIFDFAFRGEAVYAAGATGLYVSFDSGASWTVVRDFPLVEADGSPDARYLPPRVPVLSVATTDDALWIGTTQGLVALDRDLEPLAATGAFPAGRGWRLFRTDVPARPEAPTDAVPEVETYAYPNPFSPAADRVVRIAYPTEGGAAATVRIFDFGMNLVRTLTGAATGRDQQEVVWNGQSEGGLRVPNGPYFYTVETGGTTLRGKILVLE